MNQLLGACRNRLRTDKSSIAEQSPSWGRCTNLQRWISIILRNIKNKTSNWRSIYLPMRLITMLCCVVLRLQWCPLKLSHVAALSMPCELCYPTPPTKRTPTNSRLQLFLSSLLAVHILPTDPEIHSNQYRQACGSPFVISDPSRDILNQVAWTCGQLVTSKGPKILYNIPRFLQLRPSSKVPSYTVSVTRQNIERLTALISATDRPSTVSCG